MKVLAKIPRAVEFAAFYLKELIVSNLRVARDIVVPSDALRPGIVGIPLDARTDFEIFVLANLISMTPGTLSVDVSTDRSTLYVHSIYVSDPDEVVASIKETLERRVLALMQ